MNLRQEKGITLIALVITIIVMLILVGVTITIAVNGGLFDYAKHAATKTNEAKEYELGLGSTINELINYYVPNDASTTSTIVSVHYYEQGDEKSEDVNITGRTQAQAMTDIQNVVMGETVLQSDEIFFAIDKPGGNDALVVFDNDGSGCQWHYGNNSMPSDVYCGKMPSQLIPWTYPDDPTIDLDGPTTLSGGVSEPRDLSDYVGMTWLQWATDPNNTEPFYIRENVDLRDVITSSYADNPENVIQYNWHTDSSNYYSLFVCPEGTLDSCAPTDVIRAGTNYGMQGIHW